MKHLESRLQQACVKWFDLQYPKLRQLLFAIPNGGKRSVIEAKIMSSEGIRAGVADLFLSIPNANYSGLYIEMKSGKNDQTTHQESFEEAVNTAGYKYVVIRDLDTFRATINNYLNVR